MTEIESTIIYHPYKTPLKGKSLYEGTPCPTQEAYQLLGKQGVEEIGKVLRYIIRYRKLMFGTAELSDYALTNYQSFDQYPSLNNIVVEDPFTIEEWEKEELEKLSNIDVLNSQQRRVKLLELRTPKQDLQFPERLENDDLYFVSLQGKSTLAKSEVLRRILEFQKGNRRI